MCWWYPFGNSTYRTVIVLRYIRLGFPVWHVFKTDYIFIHSYGYVKWKENGWNPLLLNAVILPRFVVSTHVLRCQLISDISKGKHCHYSQMNRGFILEVYLQDVLILGTRYREMSYTPAVVPPCKKLCPLHGKLGGPPGGSNVVAKKNSPLPLEIQSGFSCRAVCKLVSTSNERPSSHRTV